MEITETFTEQEAARQDRVAAGEAQREAGRAAQAAEIARFIEHHERTVAATGCTVWVPKATWVAKTFKPEGAVFA